MTELIKRSLQKYLGYVSPDAAKMVHVGTHENLSSAESFYINRYTPDFKKIPFYFCMPELNRVEGDYAQIYARSPWGPWCLLTLNRFSIMGVKVIEDPSEDERIRYIKEFIENFEEKAV